MQSIFVVLFKYFERHPKRYWACLIFIFSFCIFFASKIHFEQDVNKMIPHNPSLEAMNSVLNKTKTGEKIIFTVSFKDTAIQDPDSLIFLEKEFETQLMQLIKPSVRLIETQVDQDKEQAFIELAIQNLPLFMEDKDYAELDSMMQPERINANLAKSHKLLLSPAGMIAGQWISHDPLGMMKFAFERLKALNINAAYELYNGYIFNRNNKQLNFFLTSKFPGSKTRENKQLFDKTDELINQWSSNHSQIKISYFGGPAVAVGNATQMQKDTILTLSLTVLLLLILIWYVFRKKSAPLLLMLPVIFGGLLGLTVTYFVQGYISLIAIGSGAVILGIAIDFSVHFMSHARTHPDMEENVRTLVAPLTLGAFTTIGAFFALRFTNAPVLQDLGLFAGSSLLGASLFTLIFLPHLLKKFSTGKNEVARENIIDKIAKYNPDKNKVLLVLVLVITPVMFYFSGKVKFDGELMHLNYMSPKLKDAQEQLNKDNAFALSSIFVVASDSTEEGAAQKMSGITGIIRHFEKSEGIRQVVNPLTILPSVREQQGRIKRWEEFWKENKKKHIIKKVEELAAKNGFSSSAFKDFEQTLNKGYLPFDTATQNLLKSMMPNAFSSKGGEHLLITTLKVKQADRERILKEFAKQNSVIATDNQSVTQSLLALLSQDFNQVLWISGILVFLALLIAYGRIELALISFLPLAITWIWILGTMAILGLEFNIVNIIISTLIFGLGDDYSIFMMDGLMEKYKTGKNGIASTRSAVYLSVMTTIIGLGTLIFAEHPALKSIALISIIGLLCVVFISQVIQPFLFNFMIQNRADKGFMPFTLWSLIKSIFSFSYFFIGSLLLTVVGLFLIGLKPFGKVKSKYIFHYLVSKYAKSLLYIMTNLKKKVVTHNPKIFDKPAIYIANHTSFLDILATIMLHPKLVLLTNKWVWNSPVFGKIVRMAEYYPVADGAANSIETLQNIVGQGYGIVIFPEGTRSENGNIKRFKKGAFYIAEKLGLDTIPVFLHGLGYTIQKGDWLLKDGSIEIRLAAPILLTDKRFGTGYSERTKKISKWFKEEYKEQKGRLESPVYFKEQLIKSHLYKGPVLEWYCKVKIRLENYYEPFHQLLPKSGFFYDLGCGYGFMTFMLHWSAPSRTFVGIDYDENKIITAQNNYTQNNKHHIQEHRLQFEKANFIKVQLMPCDGIVISDALHYLLPEQQEELLEQCYNALNINGVLIVRDGAADLKERHKGTKWTEIFSTKIFKFNKTKNELHFLKQDFFKNWAKKHHLRLQIIDHNKNTSNLIFVFRKEI